MRKQEIPLNFLFLLFLFEFWNKWKKLLNLFLFSLHPKRRTKSLRFKACRRAATAVMRKVLLIIIGIVKNITIMATQQTVVDLDIYTNTNRKSDTFGKCFARMHPKEAINLRAICNHIATHGSPYTVDTMEGVIASVVTTTIEKLSEGQAVKIDGLGTFRLTIENTPGGADSAYDFNVEENVVGVHIRFIPENEKFEQITSRKFMEKCVLRKAYEVTYKTVTHNSKPMKVPVYSPIVLEDEDEPTP